MRLTILGVGSLGSVFASCFASTSHSVHLHVRGERGAQTILEGVKVSGHGVESISAERFLFTCEELDIPSAFHGSSDIVLLACKSYDVPVLAELASLLLKSDGIALAVSNGLGHAETLARALGPNRVVTATTTHGAFSGSDGVVWAGKGVLNLARTPLGPPDEVFSALVKVLDEAGLSPKIESDPASMVWEKVLLNVSINPIAALAGLQNGELLAPDLFSSCMVVYREAANVAQLERVAIPAEPEFEQRLREVLEATASNECSMLQDIKEGRKTEIDSLNQAVVNKGEEHGLSLPVNQLLATLIRSCRP